MGTPFYAVRRSVAMEMNLWGGKLDGQSLGPANFTSVDVNGSLSVVYDVTRPEPDDDWNGAYMCINPGGSGDPNLSTIWRRIADDAGFVNSTGAMTLTAALPSSSYAQTSMTYELFRTFTPDQWLTGVNYSLRNSYPQRHRLVSFEVSEDPNTIFYDWGHLAAELGLTDPVTGPTATAVSDPGGKTNYWASGTYKVAYNLYNSAGETLISATTSVSMDSTKVLEFAAITAPENAIGVNYWCVLDPGGSTLSQLAPGSGVLPDVQTDNITPQAGIADRTTFVVPKIRFWGPPLPISRTVPLFNTTGLDLAGLSLKSIKRRINPGQFPQVYIDLNPQWWREVGGNTAQIFFTPNSQYALRFECITPVRVVTGEKDTTEEPLEIMISGSMLYLWNLMGMNASSQNTQIWVAEAKAAEARFGKARNYYQMPGPRKTMRRPFIKVQSWHG